MTTATLLALITAAVLPVVSDPDKPEDGTTSGDVTDTLFLSSLAISVGSTIQSLLLIGLLRSKRCEDSIDCERLILMLFR